MTAPSLTITPLASSWATLPAGALGQAGVQAQIEPEVVEERAAEGRVEEVVGHRVLLGQLALGHVGGVVVAHDQAGGVGPGDELVHLAAVDLVLLLVVAVDEVAGLLSGGTYWRQSKGATGRLAGKRGSGRGRLQVGVDRLGQRGVGLAVLVDLAASAAPALARPLAPGKLP